MRLLPILLVLPLFAFQVHAQSAPLPMAPAAPDAAAPSATAAAAANAPAASTGSAAAAKRQAAPRPHRMTWQQRFAAANATHDGHLTLQQAEAGYRTLARHFNEIDAGKKGYVTVEDISSWHKLQRAMRHSQHGHALRPQPAIHQGVMQAHPINTSATVER